MSGFSDPKRRSVLVSDDPKRQSPVASLGHIGLMPVQEGDPTPEERGREEAEWMAAGEYRPVMRHLQERKRRGEDEGELEALRRQIDRQRRQAMDELRVTLLCQHRRRPGALPRRHPRSRTSRGCCTRRRGSRRSTGTVSRAGPGDDPGESDPDDYHFSPVVGDSTGAVR